MGETLQGGQQIQGLLPTLYKQLVVEGLELQFAQGRSRNATYSPSRLVQHNLSWYAVSKSYREQ